MFEFDKFETDMQSRILFMLEMHGNPQYAALLTEFNEIGGGNLFDLAPLKQLPAKKVTAYSIAENLFNDYDFDYDDDDFYAFSARERDGGAYLDYGDFDYDDDYFRGFDEDDGDFYFDYGDNGYDDDTSAYAREETMHYGYTRVPPSYATYGSQYVDYGHIKMYNDLLIGIAVIIALIIAACALTCCGVVALITYFGRKWALAEQEEKREFEQEDASV